MIESVIQTMIVPKSGFGAKLKSNLIERDFTTLFNALSFEREHKMNALDAHQRFNEKAIVWNVDTPSLTIAYAEPQPKNEFKVIFTHDVDWIRSFEINSIYKTFRGILSPQKTPWLSLKQLLDDDAFYNNTLQLLKLEHKYNIKALYFMLSGKYSLVRYANRYSITGKKASKYLDLLKDYGAEIGLHGSYSAQINGYKHEVELLKNVTDKPITSHRNHYLRINTKTFVDQLAEAGIEFDYSVGYSNAFGFRTQWANPYNGWSYKNNNVSSLTLVPLIFMERPSQLFNPKATLKQVEQYIGYLKTYGGAGSILFHPENFLAQPKWWGVYEDMIALAHSYGANTTPF